MKKLQKLKLTQLSDVNLNEREMCRLLGSGDPGCCQCSCAYANSGGASTNANDSANNANGYTSSGYTGQVCCPSYPKPQIVCEWNCNPQSTTCQPTQPSLCN